MGNSLTVTTKFEENARLLLGLFNGICDSNSAPTVKFEHDELESLLAHTNDENRCSNAVNRLLSVEIDEDTYDYPIPKDNENDQRSAALKMAAIEPRICSKIICLITALHGNPTIGAPIYHKVSHLHGMDLNTAKGLGLDKLLFYTDSNKGFPIDRKFYFDDARIYDSLAVLLTYDTDTYDLAKIASKMALMIDNSNLRYNLNFIQICQRKGDLEEAIDTIEDKIESCFANTAMIHWRLALLYIQCVRKDMSRYNRARECLQIACKQEPTNIEYLSTYIYVCDISISLSNSNERKQIIADALEALETLGDLKPNKRVMDLVDVFRKRSTISDFEIDYINN